MLKFDKVLVVVMVLYFALGAFVAGCFAVWWTVRFVQPFVEHAIQRKEECEKKNLQPKHECVLEYIPVIVIRDQLQ